jgi:nucleoside-diphosphate-sugar epimerase
MSIKVLFIGGTGIISSACTRQAVEKGVDLYLLNRGQTESKRPMPEGTNVILGDIKKESEIERILSEYTFDVVVDWIAYNPEDIERDYRIFQGKIGQFVFISSASAYQKPIGRLPITEETPLENPFWAYSRAKIECENVLLKRYREDGFPATIVRPSHTYDKTLLPFHGHYTVIDRMRKGKKVIVHGDGTSLWVLTHHEDFAVGFLGLLGEQEAIGEAYHITSDFLLTWNQIYSLLAEAAGAEFNPIHIPSDRIAKYDPSWGAGLLGDKAHSVIFDNSKIKALVPEFDAQTPFSLGAREIMQWYDEDPSRKSVDQEISLLMDQIIEEYE